MTKLAARRIHTGNRVLDDAQKNGREATSRLNRAIFDGGVLIHAEEGAPSGSGLVFSAGVARTFAHGLGRPALGWIEVYNPDVPSAAHVGLFTTAQPPPLSAESHVTVTPTNGGTCHLFVY